MPPECGSFSTRIAVCPKNNTGRAISLFTNWTRHIFHNQLARYQLFPIMAEGFDPFLGRRWVYPNNMPIRGYQKAAVEKALFNNAMIVLPTGFGKTFIAAVVMYNFYRWYPEGKMIFVAPTRPLVAQQITECKKISGIPGKECIELTGSTRANDRVEYWTTKRVFFATPQVIENDLENDIIPAKQVRCIVIDEAHRAQGGFAYVGIVRQLHEKNRNGFRVLALSATPGSDIQKIRQVMMNLYISEVMFRSENSFDLIGFKNQKVIKALSVRLTGLHKEIVNSFISMTRPIFKELHRAGLTYSKDSIDTVSRGLLVMAMKKVAQNEIASHGFTKGRLAYLTGIATTLSYNFELLVIYGLRPFYCNVMKNLCEQRSSIRNGLGKNNKELERILGDIRFLFGKDVEPDINKIPEADVLKSHPKLTVLKEELLRHFKDNEEKTATRAMVFTKYRDSVFDVAQALRFYEPILKVGAFTGQAKDTGMSQKEQLQLVKDFREGKYNVLVATCVAEEGLDIGEIDLIICYDTSSSPISNTQRRGRTGRKRAGDVITLLTEDHEEHKLKKAGNSRRQVEEQLFDRKNYMDFRYRDAPRMVPPDIKPEILEQKIFPVEEPVEEEKKKRTRQPRGSANKGSAKKAKLEENSQKKTRKKIIDSDAGSDNDSEFEQYVAKTRLELSMEKEEQHEDNPQVENGSEDNSLKHALDKELEQESELGFGQEFDSEFEQELDPELLKKAEQELNQDKGGEEEEEIVWEDF